MSHGVPHTSGREVLKLNALPVYVGAHVRLTTHTRKRTSTHARTHPCLCLAVGGDAFITICLWKAGFAHTDPGYSFTHPDIRAFDPLSGDGIGLLGLLLHLAAGGTLEPQPQVWP